MQSLYVVFHVSLSKLLNKPAYDVTVMDDLALGGASLLSALRYRPYEVTIWAGPARGIEHRSLDKGFYCFWGVIWRSRMARGSLA